MAVMLRHLGIPSRVVTGFAAGEWSALTASFIVRQSDAHAWVEAWIPERGWVTFDPTPPASQLAARAGALGRFKAGLARLELMWDTWIVGLDLLDQQSVMASFVDTARSAAVSGARAASRWLERLAGFALPGWGPLAAPAFGAALAAALFIPGAWLVTVIARRRRRGADRRSPAAADAARKFRRFEARWAARGVRRRPGQTPRELAVEIGRLDPDSGDAARLFIEWYYQTRYGA